MSIESTWLEHDGQRLPFRHLTQIPAGVSLISTFVDFP
ncbi:hypothetical protein AM1_6175 [Acaryochloris marina MBIC11017]|uniref:Uncharacterized protein n=1 Tax=Acaryochloris marina (strain MBIC 11017) TaxID=329726 RepID=B0C4W9_ACAM1|nr:hypothetical protein AM1_6175 [Acaryochloris marina MBIC11017]